MRVSQPSPVPAPIGGWNAREAVSAMPVTDAIKMINWWPDTADVRVRKGVSDHVTGITGQVESLMPYSKPDGTQTLFAANAAGNFYNVTTAGAVGAAVVSSLTNGRWQSVNFTNSSGTSYLCCFNGVDSPRYWDNSTWTTITGASSPAITGVTTTGLVNASAHKRRLWLTEVDSLKAWYLPVDAVGGAAQALDLAGIVQRGGYLMATESWTYDGGDGPDDYWVAITSEGEVVVYQGTDVSSSSTWALVGVYRVGEPLGRRCFLKFGGDLLVICKDGVYPLSAMLAKVSQTAAITDKIRGAMSNAGATYFANFGWDLEFFPAANMLVLNVPVGEGSMQEQYVMNTITGAWGQFKDISANCFAIHNGDLYYGGSTVVGQYWTGYDDNGNNIIADLKPAFNYFNQRGRLKHFKEVRPIFVANGQPEISIGMNVDYQDNTPSQGISFSPTPAGVWGTGLWGTFEWGGETTFAEWETVGDIGTSGTLRMKAEVNGNTLKLQAIDYLYESGGIIG